MKYVNLQNGTIKIFETHCSYSFLLGWFPQNCGPFCDPPPENPKSGSPSVYENNTLKRILCDTCTSEHIKFT